MNDKKKILLWAPFGSGTHYWGPGASAYSLYRHLDKSKYELHLVHGYPDQSKYDTFDSQHLLYPCRVTFMGQIKFLLWSKIWLKKNARKFDAMHSLMPQSIGFLPALWFESYGQGKSFVKVTAKNNGFNGNSFLSKVLGLKQRRIKNIANMGGLIAISSEIVEELKEVGIPQQKINFIPNGVNISRFSPVSNEMKTQMREEFGIPNKFTVVFTGGISGRKGPSIVLKSIANLIAVGHELNFLIIGPDRDHGQEMAKIQEVLDSNPAIEKYVRIIEHVSNPEYYYKMSDVFVLPSTSEGMSNSLLEALSSGLSCLVTNISGSNDLVEDGDNGFFIKRETSDIAQKIEKLMSDKDLLTRQSVNARKVILDKYSDVIVLRNHMKLFFGEI